MRRLVIVLVAIAAGVAFAGRAQAATYYVSPTGDDAAAGTSVTTPWQTLAKVNNTEMKPGDTVLLQGGATFEGPLVPWGNGSKAKPVTYSSYGTGRATIGSQVNNIVFLHAAKFVTIQNLRLTSFGAKMHVVVGDPSTTSTDVTIRNNLITDTAGFGINDSSLTDKDWLIEGNTVTHTDETGITFRGSGFKVVGNIVRDTGLNPSEGAHGVYAKGPAAQVIGNLITNFNASGVSIRYQNSIAQGNVIGGGPIGISYFQDAEVRKGGASTIAYNRISDVGLCGIYLDDSTLEAFFVANNTIRVTGGTGINFHRVKALTLANNIVTGVYEDYIAVLRKPRLGYVESHNLWFPAAGAVFGWEGASRTFDQYRAASNQGAGDLTVAPQIDTSSTPTDGSNVIDAGYRVKGLSYLTTCNGRPFSVCDRAPDIGAVERKAARKRKLKRRRSAPRPA